LKTNIKIIYALIICGIATYDELRVGQLEVDKVRVDEPKVDQLGVDKKNS
jgi:hypothetical protein